MQKLQEQVEAIIRSDETGARVQKRGEHMLVILDCAEWGQQQENQLFAYNQNISITMQVSNKSLSGFIIMLSTGPASNHEIGWVVLVGLLLALNFAFCKECFKHSSRLMFYPSS